ncbi:MAG: TIGR00282 family metallophosphoesterase [Lutispora sp.]|nr:TIGR00282 family metallophosphoesterase [Lutispora sp.]
MIILFIGDIFGRTGRKIIKENLYRIKEEYAVDLAIANGENSAGGVGITKDIYDDLLSYGIDIITLGNHAWAQKKIFDFIDDAESLIRPANYPPGTPGKPYTIIEVKNRKVAIINMCGRVFMECIECPFKTIENILLEIENKADIKILDFHAEATSEKVAMGWFLDGRITAMFGTHTHIQTGDERILPKGTGYITDVGMTGPLNSVLGVKKDIIIKKFVTNLPGKFEVEEDSGQFNGVILEIDENNIANSIKRLNLVEFAN